MFFSPDNEQNHGILGFRVASSLILPIKVDLRTVSTKILRQSNGRTIATIPFPDSFLVVVGRVSSYHPLP